ncbi:hypothetical protein VI08_00945 [Luteibacter yeojuensis]|uniref:Tetratricopeptide repeat protein n=2 Tax=Luteibacter yeojuensis TaxID=345309 RepID=A0A0F3L0T9_9GAMM|nr:hypothetical protein VI08_00945 [Luteibacter yeojuensis]
MACGACMARAQDATPYVPARDDVVLQRVPPRTDPRVRQFDTLRAAVAAKPGDVAVAVALAHAYIDYGRSTGDARYLGRAMAVIEPFMRTATPPVPVALAHATILQSRHAFNEARAELEAVLRRDPDSAQGWLTLASVAMVQGDYAAANHACVQLANAAGGFMGQVCSASLRSLDGHAPQAYALLTMIEDPGPRAPPDIRAWIEGLMADTAARMGKPDVADGHFRSALRWAPGDNFLLADYGEFLLDQGRAAEALTLVAGDTQSDTSFLVRVRAEAMLGLPAAAIDTATMDARFADMARRGDHLFLREQADFLLHIHHDAAAALALAELNWKTQRAPKDARVFLEAALAAGQPRAAAPVIAFVAASGMSDPTIDPLVAKVKAQP